MVLVNFKSIIASREYHVYKETTWSDAKVDAKIDNKTIYNFKMSRKDINYVG